VRIARISIGTIEDGEPRVLEVEPFPEGPTIVPHEKAEAIAAAVRHALSRPEPRSDAEIPFVRIALESGELAIEVADDAAQSLRMLTEARAGALPLVIEAGAEDDAELEALLLRISAAAGMEPEHFGIALGMSEVATSEATEEELAYVEAERRAKRLAAAVRQIDDQMTASVVPDWLWVATGFGGLGVLLTAIVFLYPETRIFLIPGLIALSVIGFAMYGWRSWSELRIRGRLQIERGELRARREDARASAREQRERLLRQGRDPDAVMAKLEGIVIPKSVPAVLARPVSVAELLPNERQAIVFVEPPVEHARMRALTRSKNDR
jgi:hypothetical protein